ncbi:hypothetical protein Tco_0561742 [Tanacetum coccineum]
MWVVSSTQSTLGAYEKTKRTLGVDKTNKRTLWWCRSCSGDGDGVMVVGWSRLRRSGWWRHGDKDGSGWMVMMMLVKVRCGGEGDSGGFDDGSGG